MALLLVALWVAATAWQLSACERPVMKQMSCGTATAVQVAKGSQKVLTTPNFPLNYGPSKVCTWNYKTATTSVLKVACVVNIACSDNLLLSLAATKNKTYCGAKAVVETSIRNTVTISLRANRTSPGGFGMCTVSATSPLVMNPEKKTTAKQNTGKPSRTSPKPKTTRRIAKTTAAGIPATPAKNPLTTTRKQATIAKPATNSPALPDSSKCTCGIGGSNRILGGEPTGEKEFPWMVVLLDGDCDLAEILCPGSIIAPNWVVTAASCDSSAATFVSAGRQNIINSIDTGQISAISAIFKHPLYNSAKLDNDIALVQLTTPFTYNSMIAPVCLPVKFPTYDFSNQIGIATGWGELGGRWGAGYTKVSLPILTSEECKKIPRVATLITNNTVCTYEIGKEPCQNDRGGPLNWVDPATGRMVLAGIMSWDLGCDNPDAPDVYTKVNNYLPWIQKTTGLTFCNS